eukprot:TRINITY_DN792_c0_g1_i11.p2 TRINITY_DN792_c0_g1~~TRINITY_DN792_c0_g1_i11.p2  ORF type:complete len:361 (+),score=128.94 TRINITY_DN792_c0_g1_i11:147-1229(+)
MKFVAIFFLFALCIVSYNARATTLAQAIKNLVEIQQDLGITPDYDSINNAIQLVQNYITGLISQEEQAIDDLIVKYDGEIADLEKLISDLQSEQLGLETEIPILEDEYNYDLQEQVWFDGNLTETIIRSNDVNTTFANKKAALEEEIEDKTEIIASIEEVIPKIEEILGGQGQRDELRGKINAGGNQQYIGFSQLSSSTKAQFFAKLSSRKQISPQIKALIQLVLTNKEVSDSTIQLLEDGLNKIKAQFALDIDHQQGVLANVIDMYNTENAQIQISIATLEEDIANLEDEMAADVIRLNDKRERLNFLDNEVPAEEQNLVDLQAKYASELADEQQVLADYKDILQLLDDGKDQILKMSQ